MYSHLHEIQGQESEMKILNCHDIICFESVLYNTLLWRKFIWTNCISFVYVNKKQKTHTHICSQTYTFLLLTDLKSCLGLWDAALNNASPINKLYSLSHTDMLTISYSKSGIMLFKRSSKK